MSTISQFARCSILIVYYSVASVVVHYGWLESLIVININVVDVIFDQWNLLNQQVLQPDAVWDYEECYI